MAGKKKPLIVISGMDGSGKTTLAIKVAQFLREGGLDIELHHGHAYSVSRDSFGLSEAVIKRLKFFLIFLLPFAYADNLFTFYFRYIKVLNKKVLITDRYFYDKLARMVFFKICSRNIARIYLKLLPKPDYSFFLTLDAQEAFNRKGEYTVRELDEFRSIYLFIARLLNATIVDTSLPIDTCLKQIVNVLEKNL